MSSEAPPIYDVSIFIPSYWADQTTSGFDKTYADNHYLKFPVGQGTEYIPDLVVSGTTTLGATSASSLNMGGGNITNVTNINGSAYPQAAGINAVLGAGNTATNKTLNMVTGATFIESINLTCSLPNTGSTQIAYNSFITGDGNKILNMDFDNGLTLKQVGATSLGYSKYTADELRIAPSLLDYFSIYNSIKQGSSVIYDGLNYASISSNTSTPISTAIADGTYTATLLSNALNLITNASSTLRNAISNTGMTLTGSTTSVLNTIVAASNTLTDGTRTIFTGMISSVATIKLNAALSGGNSVIINPTTIGLYTTDGTTTTNRTELTQTEISVVGSAASISSKITTNGLVVLNSGGGSRVEPTQIYVAGGGGVSTAMKRDASTSVAAISTNLNAAFTPNTTIGAAILLQNADTSAGLTGGNPIIYERTKTTAVGDVIGSHHYWMKDAGGTRKEYARTTAVVKDATTSSIDGSLDFQVATNGTLASMLELNGSVDKVVAYKSIIIDPTGGSATANVTNITNTTTTITGSTSTSTITLNPTQSTFYNGGVGCRISPTSVNMSGGSGVGGGINRDASTANSTFYAIASAAFTPDATAGAQINLSNSNTSAGLVGGNPIIYERTKTTAVGDVIGSHHYWMKDAGGTRREYARTTAVVKDATTGSIDGSLDFQVATSGTLASMLELNGLDNQIDALKPLDMNNNSIVSSTGDITLNSSGSSGTGNINLTTKSTGGLIFTGTALQSNTSSGNSGEHLVITLNGLPYKIALQNP